MRKIVEVFTNRSEDGKADWMITGPEIAFKIDPHIRAFVIEDKKEGRIWFFPMETVECMKVSDDRRTATERQQQINDANDRSPN